MYKMLSPRLPQGTHLGLPSFAALIERPFPEGLGWRVDDVKTIMRLRHKHEHHTAAIKERMDLLRVSVGNLLTDDPPVNGGDRRSEEFQRNNVTLNEDRGNSPEYALRRLKRDEPELAQRVLKGELSAHAAAVQAGFRPRTITVPLDPEKMARAIRRRLSDDELDVIMSWS